MLDFDGFEGGSEWLGPGVARGRQASTIRGVGLDVGAVGCFSILSLTLRYYPMIKQNHFLPQRNPEHHLVLAVRLYLSPTAILRRIHPIPSELGS